METIYYHCESTGPEGHYAATIGFFDGVHLGHRFLLGQLKEQAKERGLQSMVITFEQHPRQVIHSDWHPRLLSTLEEKKALLAETGIDLLVVLRFDMAMAQLSAHDFMQLIAHDLHVRLLLTGYDNHFGRGRTDGFDQYVSFGRELGIEVVRSVACKQGDLCYSSSLVRRLLDEGDVDLAARCLGRHYALSGKVVHGRAVGRKLGFPTANVMPSHPEQMVPADGVYCVRVCTEGWSQAAWGVMNIGMRPTFDGHETTLEVHILDFQGNLYEQLVKVEFMTRLRSEKAFETPEALAAQMQLDVEETKKIISNYGKSY
jgi:riboflavin kinase/FMN adenylyltransferase